MVANNPRCPVPRAPNNAAPGMTPKDSYSAADLAALKAPAYPTTRKGIWQRAASENWDYQDVAGGGGKNGKRREYWFVGLPQGMRDAIINRCAQDELDRGAGEIEEFLTALFDAYRNRIDALLAKLKAVRP